MYQNKKFQRIKLEKKIMMVIEEVVIVEEMAKRKRLEGWKTKKRRLKEVLMIHYTYLSKRII